MKQNEYEYKILQVIILSLGFFSGLPILDASPRDIISDDFNSYETGPADANLKSSLGGVFQQDGRWQVRLSVPKPHVMEITSSTDDNGEINKYFRYRKMATVEDSLAGGLLHKIPPKLPQPITSFGLDVRIRNGDENNNPFTYVSFANILRIYGNGNIEFRSADSGATLQSLNAVYTPREWCTLRIECDLTADLATLSVNGEKAGECTYPEDALKQIKEPRWQFFGFGKADSVFCIDDIRLWVTQDDAPVPVSKTDYRKGSPDTCPVLDFETEGDWLTAPPELPSILSRHGLSTDDLWCTRSMKFSNFEVFPVAWSSLAGGAVRSAARVRNGKYSYRWANHHQYPTLACNNFPGDWSAYRAFEIQIYSEVNTGQQLVFALLADNPINHWKDYFLHRMIIDWVGWKTIRLSFKSLEQYESPTGFSNITGIYFFTKMYGANPNPATVLHIDSFRLLKEEVTAAPAGPAAAKFYYKIRYPNQPQPLNHSFPELTTRGPVSTPEKALTYQHYFRGERALHGYYPRFSPGFPSFTPDGKVYLNAGDTIQWADDSGRWHVSDIKAVLTNWASSKGWQGAINFWGNQGPDTSIRFDKSGDAYVLQMLEPTDSEGVSLGWSNRTSLLLHSRDGMKSWTVHQLPVRLASFEKSEYNHTTATEHPPVILLSDYPYFPSTDKAGYLLIPEKNTDGSLNPGVPVKFADLVLGVNYHSGDATIVLSYGEKIFIAYGWCPDPGGFPDIKTSLMKDTKDLWSVWNPAKLASTPIGKTMPNIPSDHPALSMKYPAAIKDAPPEKAVNGVPTFIVEYDRRTKRVSQPVFLGYGGGFLDGHNWPALTSDKKGFIHVIINGHHNPVTYTRSLKPRDISKWTPPEYILVNTDQPKLSYAAFTSDRHDNLYSIHRSTLEIYNNRLVLYRKQSGGEWESERTIVAPFKLMYGVWYHKLVYDPTRDRLFLTYYAVPGTQDITWDSFEFFVFALPDIEKPLSANAAVANDGERRKGGSNRGHTGPEVKGNNFYLHVGRDIVTLVSSDGGDNWRLAVTADFINKN